MGNVKVGDKVKVIKNGKNCSKCGPVCVHLGHEGIVCEINGKKIGVDNFPGTLSWCSSFSEDNLQVIIKEEPMTHREEEEVKNGAYQKGDRVLTIKGIPHDKHGTVISDDGGGFQSVLVEFDENIQGHDGEGKGKIGHCWWVSKSDLKLTNWSTKERSMKKAISDVYEKTQDALLVEKHLNIQISDGFTGTLLLTTYKAEYLAEAKRLEKEEIAKK